MTTQTTDLINQRLLLIILAPAIAMIAIFLLVDRSIAIALLIGIVLASALRLRSKVRDPRVRMALLASAVIIVVASVVFLLMQLGPVIRATLMPIIDATCMDPPCGGPGPRLCKGIQISTDDLTGGTFHIMSGLTTKDVISRNSGFLLKEISFDTRALLTCVPDSTHPMTVELIDLPRNVFFQARGANGLTRATYLNTETITWEQKNARVTLSYLPRGLRFLQQPLAFFYGIGSVGEGIMGVLGFVGTFAVSAIIQPTFGDMARDRLKDWIAARRKRKDEPESGSQIDHSSDTPDESA